MKDFEATCIFFTIIIKIAIDGLFFDRMAIYPTSTVIVTAICVSHYGSAP